jgi:hypothetical protein
MCFFKKIAQNQKRLAFNFIENNQFAPKIDQTSVFLSYKVKISDQLHIMVLHVYLLAQNSKVVLRFTKNVSLW